MTQRYKIVDESLSAHCCFSFTIIDTDKPKIINSEHYTDHNGNLQYETVAECFEEYDAQLICAALNSYKGDV